MKSVYCALVIILAASSCGAEESLDGRYLMDFEESELFQARVEKRISGVEKIRKDIANGKEISNRTLEDLAEAGIITDDAMVEPEAVADLVVAYVKERMSSNVEFNVTTIEIVGSQFEYFPAIASGTEPVRICTINEINTMEGLSCKRDGYDDYSGIIKVDQVNGLRKITVKLTGSLGTTFVQQ